MNDLILGQISLFDSLPNNEKKDVNYKLSAARKSIEDTFDYEADNAEAVIYLITKSGKLNKQRLLYVMKRSEAIQFCTANETRSINGNMSWAYAFTTHRRDWRECLDEFRKDDGRFNGLLLSMGITPIYKAD